LERRKRRRNLNACSTEEETKKKKKKKFLFLSLRSSNNYFSLFTFSCVIYTKLCITRLLFGIDLKGNETNTYKMRSLKGRIGPILYLGRRVAEINSAGSERSSG
jgi:hypothetical protein